VGREAEVRTGQLAQDLIFETRDGYITTGAVSDAEWRGLCAALERSDWLEDERFQTTQGRFRHARERLAQTAEVLRHKTSEEWLERLDAHSVPCAPVLTRPQVLEHEQVRANELIYEYEHPGLGRIRQPRPAARFDATPPHTRPVAPRLGEHTREILSAYGYAAEEVDALLRAGTVVAAD